MDVIAKITSKFNANVLVGEDYPLNSAVIKKMLELLGCKVVIAEDGRKVFSIYKKAKCDIIFLDVQMPEINGYEVTKIIRSYEKHDFFRIPIIAVTANALIGDKEKCLNSGMDDYISKPIRAKNLEVILDRYVPKLRIY
jgi:CheY-like chemotaxis protein